MGASSRYTAGDNRRAAVNRVEDGIATAELSFSLAEREAQLIAQSYGVVRRCDFAASFCTTVVRDLWTAKAKPFRLGWACRTSPAQAVAAFPNLVRRITAALATLPEARAGFLVGQLYTLLLPDRVRKTLGAYYTPPPLVERLLVLIDQTGFDWSAGRIIDPACGGAAFLASVAPKLVAHSSARTGEAKLADLEKRLCGVELDPVAAWISMVLLDICLLKLTAEAGRPANYCMIADDALNVGSDLLGQFDLVIGNPPYGKITLAPAQRSHFRRSIFGHANLYAVFTELAVELTNRSGLIAFVTPTSFLGGQYFKNLRSLLAGKAPMIRADFVRDRNGVFGGVLQETMLALFKRGGSSTVDVNVVRTTEATQPVIVEHIGRIRVAARDGEPWVIPRSSAQLALLESAAAMTYRLKDYGFAVSTGQLVWNRHKTQLRARYSDGCYPIVWAEAVGSDGAFRFQAARRAHLPYIKITSAQRFLVNQEPCILVQRTTAKEQKRRLIAAVVPNSFILEHPGYVVENHLNMVYATLPQPPLALHTIAALLNSPTFDLLFRCVSGSVAVSAYELNSLPMPALEQMQELQEAVLAGQTLQQLEDLISSFYRARRAQHFHSTAPAAHSSPGDRQVAA